MDEDQVGDTLAHLVERLPDAGRQAPSLPRRSAKDRRPPANRTGVPSGIAALRRVSARARRKSRPSTTAEVSAARNGSAGSLRRAARRSRSRSCRARAAASRKASSPSIAASAARARSICFSSSLVWTSEPSARGEQAADLVGRAVDLGAALGRGAVEEVDEAPGESPRHRPRARSRERARTDRTRWRQASASTASGSGGRKCRRSDPLDREMAELELGELGGKAGVHDVSPRARDAGRSGAGSPDGPAWPPLRTARSGGKPPAEAGAGSRAKRATRAESRRVAARAAAGQGALRRRSRRARRTARQQRASPEPPSQRQRSLAARARGRSNA